ncbi:erythroferrone-like [Ornithodoros turicata]|uniref:erythroferrone-like n=1 Tax=Ornithodoros turicata TaxID=34597 RepID=UPI0031388DEE
MVTSAVVVFGVACAVVFATVVLCDPSRRSTTPEVPQKLRTEKTPRKLGAEVRAVTARRTGLRATGSSSQRSVSERPMVLDPRQTWQAFLRHSERTQSRRPKKKVKSSLLRMQGPQGPPGPRGPRGPAGANITREEMFREFRELLRQAVEARIELLAEAQCKSSGNCSALSSNLNSTDILQSLPWVPQLFEVNHIEPRTRVSFFWELSQDVRVKRGKEIKLRPFHRPFADGSMERGSDGFNASDGIFRAPTTGLYVFFGSIFLRRVQSSRVVRKELDQPPDHISAVVCVDDPCYKHLSLRTTTSLTDSQDMMTLHVNGPLMLKAGQEVTLWIWNRSRFGITVEQGSQLSGFLAGL